MQILSNRLFVTHFIEVAPILQEGLAKYFYFLTKILIKSLFYTKNYLIWHSDGLLFSPKTLSLALFLHVAQE